METVQDSFPDKSMAVEPLVAASLNAGKLAVSVPTRLETAPGALVVTLEPAR